MTTEEKITEEKRNDEKTTVETDDKTTVETDDKTTVETDDKTTVETDDKTTEEKMTENKMDKEEIIDNYIDHIRDVSELTDVEIALVIDDAIEEDEEFLDILEKLLSRREKLSEKIIFIKEDRGEKEEKDKDEKREEIDDILEAFDDDDYAYPLEELIESLRDSGYADPGTVIVDAISDGILCVDSIDEDEVTYLALSKEGESLWESHNA